MGPCTAAQERIGSTQPRNSHYSSASQPRLESDPSMHSRFRPGQGVPQSRPAWIGGSQKRPEPGADGFRDMPAPGESPMTLTLNVRRSAKFFEVQHAYQNQGAIYKLFQGSMTGLCRAGCLALQAQTPLPLTSLSCMCALLWMLLMGASVPRRGKTNTRAPRGTPRTSRDSEGTP